MHRYMSLHFSIFFLENKIVSEILACTMIKQISSYFSLASSFIRYSNIISLYQSLILTSVLLDIKLNTMYY